MQVVGVSLMALGVFGLVALTLHIAWQEIQALRYVSRLDEWAEEVPEWH